MSAKYKDYPIYSYDEPAIYEDFTGGINTDPSNEHLMANELRDCVNMTYLSGALVKRKGAKQIATISCEDTLKIIQGVFLFTYKLTYIIIAADGKLYYGIYNENTTIPLIRLHINYYATESTLAYDPTNVLVGLEEYNSTIEGQHDGYLREVINKLGTSIQHEVTYRGKWFDIPNGETILTYDLVEMNNGDPYIYMGEPFKKTIISPITSTSDTSETIYWEEYTDSIEGLHIEKWEDTKSDKWYKNTIVYLTIEGETKYFRCKETHINYKYAINNPKLFVNGYYGEYNKETYLLAKELYFQNYRKVEGVTFNNKLYIATGTRIIEIGLNTFLSNINPSELSATPVIPTTLNMTEVVNIGYNYMSPYPEFCLGTQLDTVTTSIRNILPIKDKITGTYTLTPIMNFQMGDNPRDYLYRWEKYIDGKWYVVKTFAEQNKFITTNGITENIKLPQTTLTVTDADRYQYRVTFAKSFEYPSEYIQDWDSSIDYKLNDFVSVGARIYKCVHSTNSIEFDTEKEFYTTGYKKITNEDGTTTTQTVLVWTEVFELEELKEYKIDPSTQTITINTIYDYKIDKVTGDYFGSATSVLAKELSINDTFRILQSCTKIHIDGNKLLFYGDAFNSGQWFKTIINNPGYITDRGCLSFKTTKNEQIVKVVSFQGNIIVFANSETTGGSIHMVTGNGDDYNAEDGYYSPYKRVTINASISCDNANTVQICDNLLLFKYFNRVYYIDASDLSNEVIQVNPCNDRLLHNSEKVIIPWDDNSCISEVTDTYYGLIWKEKYSIDSNDQLVLEHPAIRLKMYYKMANKLKDNSYTFPWLKDESEYLNITDIIYIKGKPIYLYNNLLLSFSENYYKDLEKNYECTVHLRGVDLNYPKLFKLISNVIIYFHRNQYSKVTFDTEIKNESGHILFDPKIKTLSLQDLKALRADKDSLDHENIRLDSTILDTKVLNATYKFPCLLADTVIKATNEGEFSLSSITFNYTTIDTPDTNPYDLYSNILRTKGVK